MVFLPGFKGAFNPYKYQSNIKARAWNPYLDYLIGPSFQGINQLFAISFEDKKHRDSHKYFLLTAK